VPTIQDETADGWWARRKGAFAHPTESISNSIICGYSFAISPQVCARFTLEFPALSYQRAQGMPGADAPAAARGVVVSTRVSHHGHTGITRHSPRNGLRLISRSPRGPGSFAPVTFAEIASRENLTPASGRQDHTILPSASSAVVCSAIRVHRSPPHVRDDRETSL
jgi:hypothetical protein